MEMEGKNKDRKAYSYQCPECLQFVGSKLHAHLMKVHNYEKKAATLKQSEIRVKYCWLSKDTKHAVHTPNPCDECGQWFADLRNHLYHSKTHINLTKVLDDLMFLKSFMGLLGKSENHCLNLTT